MLKKTIALFVMILMISCGMHTGPDQKQATSEIKEAYFEALRLRGNYAAVAGALKKIIERDDRFYPAYWSLVELYTANEELEKGLFYFSGLADPANPYPSWALGLLSEQMGLYDEAMGYHKSSIEIENAFYGSYVGVVDTSLKNAGNDESAVAETESYLNRLAQLEPLNAAPYYGLGYFLAEQDNWDEALGLYEKSFLIAREIGYKKLEGVGLFGIGEVYYRLSNYSKALEYGEKALSIFKNTGQRELECGSLYLIGKVKLALKEYNRALPFFREAITITESLRGRFKNEQFKTAFFEQFTNLYRDTIACLYELHRQNPAKGFDSQAFTYAEKSKARGLLDLLAESNADIRQGVDPELRALERVLEREYARNNSILQEILSRPTAEIDEELVEALKGELKKLDDKMEELKVKIVRTNPRYAELKYPEPVTIDQIQQSLPDTNTLFIEYKVTKEAVFAWRITKNEFRFFKLNIGEEDLTHNILYLRNCLTGMMGEELFTPRSAELYNLLVKPLLENTPKPETLLIIPDGILNYLPFETLAVLPADSDYIKEETGFKLTYKEMPFLIKEYTIRYAQSAGVAYSLARRTKSETATGGLLAMGDPVFFDDEQQPGNFYIRSAFTEEEQAKLQRLVHSGEEVKNIGRLFNKPAIYVREEAKEELVKSPGLENYRYIHLAAHGKLNENNPGLSGIVLTQDADPAEDGFLLTREVFNLNLNADLVVLSACSTGLGKNVGGEGIVGLTRAWLYAGTSSLVVSLWNINDRSTSLLMEAFYKNIQNGAVYSRALKDARLKLIESKDYSDPYYWAGFILLGGE